MGHDAIYTRLILPTVLAVTLTLVLFAVLGIAGVVLTCRASTLSRGRKAVQCLGVVGLVVLLPMLLFIYPVAPRFCWKNRNLGQSLIGCGAEQCVYSDPDNDTVVIKALPVPGYRRMHYQLLSSCGPITFFGTRVCNGGMQMRCTADRCPGFAYIMHRGHGLAIMENWKYIRRLQQTNDPLGRFFPTVRALDYDRMLVTVDRIPDSFDRAIDPDRQLAELNAHLKRLDLRLVDVGASNMRSDSAGHLIIIDPHLIGPKTWATLRSRLGQRIFSFHAQRYRGHSQLIRNLGPFFSQ